MSADRTLSVGVDELAAGVLAGDRAKVARAITLVESSRPDHADQAQELLLVLQHHAGRSHRVGISGIPGAGKSTLIDRLGTSLTGAGHRVAVLAVDPSSTRRGGSILGDKTRMTALAADPQAFIRPSPSAGWLGGVTRSTREAIVVVEAAGYDVVIVETVGTGQSESAVADMVDTFVLLTVPGTGDELQGIKRGVLELADVVVVNKADHDRIVDARRVARELVGALHLFEMSPVWTPQVLLCSAIEGTGIGELWEVVSRHRALLAEMGESDDKRDRQQREWMWSMVRDGLMRRLDTDQGLRPLTGEVEAELARGLITPEQGARRLLEALIAARPVAATASEC